MADKKIDYRTLEDKLFDVFGMLGLALLVFVMFLPGLISLT